MMTPKNLESLGRERYGDAWRAAFCTDYGVTDRTVRLWMAGAQIPKWAETAMKDAVALMHCRRGIAKRMKERRRSSTEAVASRGN